RPCNEHEPPDVHRARPAPPGRAGPATSVERSISMTTPVGSSFATALLIVAAMAGVALVETVAPLHARGRWYKAHLKPNLALTMLTFATNVVFNTALVGALLAIQERHAGVLERTGFSALATAIIA